MLAENTRRKTQFWRRLCHQKKPRVWGLGASLLSGRERGLQSLRVSLGFICACMRDKEHQTALPSTSSHCSLCPQFYSSFHAGRGSSRTIYLWHEGRQASMVDWQEKNKSEREVVRRSCQTRPASRTGISDWTPSRDFRSKRFACVLCRLLIARDLVVSDCSISRHFPSHVLWY